MSTSDQIFKRSEFKRKSIVLQIADKLEQWLLNEEIPVNQQLPSESDLADLFNVNRVTVGKALDLLSQRGLVSRQSGRGTFVKAINYSTIVDSIGRYFQFNGCSHDDMLGLREILEPEAATLAAKCATEQELENLREQMDILSQETRGNNVERYVEADILFHEIIAKASHNKMIRAIVCALHQTMTTWTRAQYAVDSRDARQLEDSLQKHIDVFDAVTERDPTGAGEAMRALIGLAHHSYEKTSHDDRC